MELFDVLLEVQLDGRSISTVRLGRELFASGVATMEVSEEYGKPRSTRRATISLPSTGGLLVKLDLRRAVSDGDDPLSYSLGSPVAVEEGVPVETIDDRGYRRTTFVYNSPTRPKEPPESLSDDPHVID